MKKDAEDILVEYNHEAGKCLESIYENYEMACTRLDRQRDENVFQQLTAQYNYTLRHQLEEIALRLIDTYKARIDNITQLQRMLTGRIEFFLNEFNRRSAFQ